MKLKINDYIITIPKDLEPLLGTAAYKDTGIFSGNVVEVGEDGKIPAVLLPSVAVNNTYVVDNEESMLAIEANVGDIAVRTDVNESYILREYPANDIRNWVKLLTSTTGVTSFNGQKGDVIFEVPYYQATGEEANGALTPYGARKELYADAGKSRVQIGNGTKADGNQATAIGLSAHAEKDYTLAAGVRAHAREPLTVALGNSAQAFHERSVALGANSTTTRNYTVAVNYGATNRIIEGVKDPEQSQDAATKNYVDGKIGGAGAHTITLEGSPLDLTVGDHTYASYDSVTKENNFEFNVTVSESNWDDSLPIRRLIFLEDTIDNSMEITTYRLVSVEYSLPENNFTVDGFMTYQNVGGTFVYTLKVSVTKGGSEVDLSNYVTLDTDQTILGNKSFGQFVTTGKGEEGQVTTIGKDGTVTQIQKIAGSNEYSEISLAYGHVTVTKYQADGTPLRVATFSENGVGLATDRGRTDLIIDSNWTANGAFVSLKNGIMHVTLKTGAPKANISGADGVFKQVAKLPEEFRALIPTDIEFVWSNYGGQTTFFSGRLTKSDGALNVYCNPTSTTITPNNRFNISLTFPIDVNV